MRPATTSASTRNSSSGRSSSPGLSLDQSWNTASRNPSTLWRVMARVACASVAHPHACTMSKHRVSCAGVRHPGESMVLLMAARRSPLSSASKRSCRASGDVVGLAVPLMEAAHEGHRGAVEDLPAAGPEETRMGEEEEEESRRRLMACWGRLSPGWPLRVEGVGGMWVDGRGVEGGWRRRLRRCSRA